MGQVISLAVQHFSTHFDDYTEENTTEDSPQYCSTDTMLFTCTEHNIDCTREDVCHGTHENMIENVCIPAEDCCEVDSFVKKI